MVFPRALMPPHLRPRCYQMFRYAKSPSRCCAVLDGVAFPRALSANDWAPAEYLDERDTRPPGFDEAAAYYACVTQGFYLFQWGERKWRAALNPTNDPRTRA
jgi:hypothetical protein